MPSRRKSKKRPCRICRKWFKPDPRVGDRQKTCGSPNCKAKWHAKKCAEWNKANRTCSQETYLKAKLASIANQKDNITKSLPPVIASDDHPPDYPHGGRPQLPRSLIQEVIGVQPFVIIEYLIRQFQRSFQEVIDKQLDEINRDLTQLIPKDRSRGDGASAGS